jgi:undecaprenyl-diphosphatase
MESLAGIDQGVLYWFGPLHRPWLDQVALALTRLGNTVELICISLAFLLVFVLYRRYRFALDFALLGLSAVAVNFGGKALVGRSRPDVVWRMIPLPDNDSFPSGHALCSMAIYTTAFALFGEMAGRRWLGLVGVLIGLAVGLTRPYLGVHYPSDVFAGWVAGLGLALVATALAVKREAPSPPPATGTPAAPPAATHF